MAEWRTIDEFPNYIVSNTGEIKNKSTGRSIVGHKLQNGYRQVGLFFNGKPIYRMVHRLVMVTFVGPIPPGKEVNHKDGNKFNNHTDNLEYVTHQENMNHALVSLDNPGNKLKHKDVADIRHRLTQKEKYKDIASVHRVTKATISNIAKNRAWKSDKTEIFDRRRKLTTEQVLEIKQRADNGEVHIRIAKDYNISDSTVDYIANGKLWKSVVNPLEG